MAPEHDSVTTELVHIQTEPSSQLNNWHEDFYEDFQVLFNPINTAKFQKPTDVVMTASKFFAPAVPITLSPISSRPLGSTFL